jgi:hypothetical protein
MAGGNGKPRSRETETRKAPIDAVVERVGEVFSRGAGRPKQLENRRRFPYPPQTRESGATGGCVPPAGDDKAPVSSDFRGFVCQCSVLTFYVSVTCVAGFVARRCRTAN